MLEFGVERRIFDTRKRGVPQLRLKLFFFYTHSHAIEFIDGVAELVLHVADAVSFGCQPL